MYRQRGAGNIGRRSFEREIQRHCSQALPPGQQAPGSPANHQAVDGILRLQHGSSRRRQLLCLKTAQKNAWLAVSAEHNLTFSLILEGWASTSFPLQWASAIAEAKFSILWLVTRDISIAKLGLSKFGVLAYRLPT